MRTLFRSFVFASACLLAACGGASTSIDDPTAPAPAPGGEGTGAQPGTPGDSAAPGADPDPGGPRVTVAARGTTAPFAHADGLSGATPAQQILAVRSLTLLRSATDPSPVTVFDLGDAAVEVDYVTGATTPLATVPIAKMPEGIYTIAKVGVSYVRYRVPARMHTTMGALDGHYQNVQALSEGAKIDGVTRPKGWYRYAFALGGTETGALEGAGAPTPATSGAGGIVLDTSGPQAFYVFPVQVALVHDHATDMTAVFEANVFESFRWQDQPGLGYTPGVFDTTPATFEPVIAFGANSFTLVYGAKP